MDNIALVEKIISKERFKPYLNYHKNNHSKAIAHYKSNILISESFYPLLAVLEVGLRNSIDHQLIRKLRNRIFHHEAITWNLNVLNSYEDEIIQGIEWLNREHEYRRELFALEHQESLLLDLEWARDFPVAQMRKNRWLPNSENQANLVDDLLKFFGVASPKEWNELYLK